MGNAMQTTESGQVVAINDNSALMTAIARAASDPTVDVEKMERLFAMHERMEAKQSETAFNAALSGVQARMGRIGTDKVNSQTRSEYATYGKLDRKLRPLYTEAGFALSFGTEPAGDAVVRVICDVSHRSGHSRRYAIDMPADGKGAKGNDVMTKTHATGSATQYGMRYLLKMIFNVAIGDEDDDGNGASSDFDASAWMDKIAGASSADELDRIRDEIKSTQGIPKGAKKQIVALWQSRMKEFSA